MSEKPIGPEPCSTCGGEYGEHFDGYGCRRISKVDLDAEVEARSSGFINVSALRWWKEQLDKHHQLNTYGRENSSVILAKLTQEVANLREQVKRLEHFAKIDYIPML